MGSSKAVHPRIPIRQDATNPSLPLPAASDARPWVLLLIAAFGMLMATTVPAATATRNVLILLLAAVGAAVGGRRPGDAS
jgi:hypothetical protein